MTREMRALTLTQPWAGLVASGIKKIENRSRPVIRREDFGKPFAIHAGKVIDHEVYDRIRKIAAEDPPDRVAGSWSDPTGSGDAEWYRLSKITSAVIAVATIDSVMTFDELRREVNMSRFPSWEHPPASLEDLRMAAVKMGAVQRDQTRWMFGEVCYVLRDIHVLQRPVPCRGFQSFFFLPPDVERAVLAQVL